MAEFDFDFTRPLSEQQDVTQAAQTIVDETTERQAGLLQASQQKTQELEQKRKDRIDALEINRLKEDREAGQIALDTAKSLVGKGSVGIAEFGYGVADYFSRNAPIAGQGPSIDFSKPFSLQEAPATKPGFDFSLDKATGGFSKNFDETRKIIDATLSDKLRFRKGRVADRIAERAGHRDARIDSMTAGGMSERMAIVKDEVGSMVETVKAYVENPAAAIDEALASAPQLLMGGAAGKIAAGGKAANITAGMAPEAAKRMLASEGGKRIIQRAAADRGVKVGAMAEGASNSVQIKAEVLDTSFDDLALNSPIWNDLLEVMTPEEAREEISARASDFVMEFGTLTGGVASKLSGAGSMTGNLFVKGSKLDNAVIDFLTAGVKEAAEEALQGGGGQIVSNIAKKELVDKTTKISEGVGTGIGSGLVVGGLSGQAVGGAAAVRKGAVKTAAKALGKLDIKIKEKAVQQQANANVIVDAAETGDFTTAKDNTRENFDIRASILAVSERNKNEVVTPAERATNVAEAQQIIADDFKRVETLTKEMGEMTEEKDIKVAAKEIKKAQKQQEQAIGLLQKMASGETLSQEDIDTDVKAGKSDRVMGSMRINPESVTADQAEALASHADTTPEQATELRAHATLERAKNAEEVGNDIVNGGRGFKGVNQYQQDITSAMAIGNEVGAKKALTKLTTFATRHSQKTAAVTEAFAPFLNDAAATLTTEQQEALNQVKATYGLTYKGRYPTKLINAMQSEVTLLDAAVAMGDIATGTQAPIVAPVVTEAPAAPAGTPIIEPTTTTTEAPFTVTDPADLPSITVDVPVAEIDVPVTTEPAPIVETTTTETAPVETVVAPVVDTELTTDAMVARVAELGGKVGKPIENALKSGNKKQIKKATKQLKQKLAALEPVSIGEQVAVSAPTLAAAVASETIGDKIVKSAPTLAAMESKAIPKQEADYTIGSSIVNKPQAEIDFSNVAQENIAQHRYSMTNQVAKWFSSKKSKTEGVTTNLLAKTQNFMAKLKQGRNFILEHMETNEFSEGEVAALKSMSGFDANGQKSFVNLFGAKADRVSKKLGHLVSLKSQDYVQFLADENGVIPTDVVTAINMVALNWLTTRGGDTVFNDSEVINALLGHGKDDLLDSAAYDLLQNVGIPRAELMEDMGKAITKTLGLKAKSDAPGNSQAKMDMSLGAYAMGILVDNNYLKFNPVNSQEMWLLSNPDTRGEIGFQPKVFASFYSIETQIEVKEGSERRVPIDGIKDLTETMKNAEGLFDKLFDVQSAKTKPSLKPFQTGQVRTVNGNEQEAPSRQAKGLDKHEARGNFIHEEITGVYQMMGDRAILSIAGYVNNLKEVTHAENLKAAEAKNDSILRELENLDAHLELMSKNEGKPFYMPHSVWSMGRMGMAINTFNMQASKIHRHFAGHKEVKSTVTIGSKDDSIRQFLLAVGESLGVATDKQTWANTSRADIGVLLSSQVIKDGVAAINDIGGDIDQDVLDEKIVAAVGKYGFHGLDGLVALAAYERAKTKGPGTTFESTLFREGDGVTNGPTIGTIMLAAAESITKLKEMLNRGGMFFEGETSFGDWLRNPKNSDTYVVIKNLWAQAITVAGQGSAQAAAMARIYGELARNNSKGPVTVTVYGSGKDAVARKTSDHFMSEMYSIIEKAVIAQDVNMLNELSNNVSIILGVKDALVFPNGLNGALEVKLNSKNEKRIRASVEALYGETLNDTLDEVYGTFKENGKLINKSLGMVWKVFDMIYKNEIAKETSRLVSKQLLVPGLETLSKDAEKVIRDKLIRIQPIMKTYFSSMEETEEQQLRTGLFVGKYNNVRQKPTEGQKANNEYYVNVEFKNAPAGDNNVKTMRGYGSKVEIGEPGVSPTVMAIQNTDATAMMLFIEKYAALNVHDAIIVGQATMNKDIMAMNEGFIEALEGQDIMGSAQDALNRALVEVGKYDKANGTKFVSELGDYVFSNLGKKEKAKTSINGAVRSHMNAMSATTKKVKGMKKIVMDDMTMMAQYFIDGAELQLKEGKPTKKATKEVIAQSGPAPRSHEEITTNTAAIEFQAHTGRKKADEHTFKIGNTEIKAKRVFTVGGMNFYIHKSLASKGWAIVSEFSTARVVSGNMNQAELINKAKRLIEQVGLEKFTAVIKQSAKDSPLGSSESQIDIENFNADTTIDVNATSSVQIFDSLPQTLGVRDSSDHVLYLRELLEETVNKVLTPFQLHLKGSTTTETQGATTTGDMYIINQVVGANDAVSGILANGIRMSAQEVYMHEISHIISRAGIDRGQGVALRELKQLWRLAKDNIMPADFLSDPTLAATDPTYEFEIAAAQARYDHIFTIRTNQDGSADYLHEFMAFGKTNANFRKLLGNLTHTANTQKIFEGNVLEVLSKMFTRALDLIGTRINATTGLTADAALDQLFKELSGLNARKRSRIELAATSVTDFANQKIIGTINIVKSKVSDFTEMPLFKNSKFAIIRAAGAVTNVVANERTEFLTAAVRDAAKTIREGKESFIGSVVTEMMGRTDANGAFHDLNRYSNRDIDQQRNAIATGVAEVLVKEYTRDLSELDKVAITKAMLKTDMSSLIQNGYSIDQMVDFLKDNKIIDVEISTLEAALTGRNKNFYRRQADNLGYWMATGRTREHHTLFNATQIADLAGTGIDVSGDTTAAVKTIDSLASLYAIRNTVVAQRTTLAEIIQEEQATGTENGIQFTLAMLVDMKQDAKARLFVGHDAMIKGYTKEMYNPHIDLQYATEDEGAELEAQGYTRAAEPIPRDPLDPNQAAIYQYKNPDGGLARYSAGIISQTSMRAKGASTITTRIQAGDTAPGVNGRLDIAKLVQRKQGAIREMFNKRKVTKPLADNILFPILGENKSIIGYRYMMNEMTKDDLLEKHNGFDAIMGGMAASTVDKVETGIINNRVVNALKMQYDEDFDDNSAHYVEIGPQSSDKELREIWAMLPQAAKNEVQRVWKGQSMQVRSDLVVMIFGQRKMTITDLWKTDPETRKWHTKALVMATRALLGRTSAAKVARAEDVWQEIVKGIKDIIVIKSIVVTAANTLSNMVFLKMMGVPLRDIFKNQAEALEGALKWQKDSRELMELELKQKVGNTADTQRIAELKNNLHTNPVRELIEAGVFQTIVEDVEVADSKFSFKSKLDKKFEKVTSRIPQGIKTVAKNMLLTHDTKAYKMMNQAAQLSDFVARYALHKHMTTRKENPLTSEQAIQKVVSIFINYDLPTHKSIQYGNDMGFVWFSKYNLRIQRVIMESFKENPARVMMILALQSVMGDIPDIYDSAVMGGYDPTNMLRSPLTQAGTIFDIAPIAAVDGAIDVITP